jgi:hypothetical protein
VLDINTKVKVTEASEEENFTVKQILEKNFKVRKSQNI